MSRSADAQAASGPQAAGQIRPFPRGVGGDRRRQDARDRADRSVEREFADDRVAFERVVRDGADRRHDAERDRQVVMAALLGHVGGREIDGDALGGQRQARGDKGGSDTLARFGDRLVAEADDHEDDRPRGDLHLHVDGTGLDPLERHGRNTRHHLAPLAG